MAAFSELSVDDLKRNKAQFFYFFSRLWQAKRHLLDIMYGYPCDKAVTKNDTREAIWYHFTAVKWCHITSRFELSNEIDWINLVGPIGLHVIFSAEPWRQIWWEELLCSSINLVAWFFWRICNKQKYYMLRAWYRFYSRFPSTISLTRSKTLSFAIWH